MIVRRYADARAFLDRAEPWLLLSEIEHGLILGLAHQLTVDDSRYEPPIYWATIEDQHKIIGCAFRTPPHRVLATDLPPEAIEALVEDVGQVYDFIPGVSGAQTTASSFAAAWVARRGGSWSIRVRQRIHSLDKVLFPPERASGVLRLAAHSDTDLIDDWASGFIRDTGVHHRPEEYGQKLVDENRLFLWEDGEPRAMVGTPRETPHAAGIAPVYTPERFRGRGYATVAVASMSQLLLDRGFTHCFLYTDLANPTSNAIYGRIGYRAVRDIVEIDLESPPA